MSARAISSTSFTYDAQALTLADLRGRLLGGTLRGSLTVPARTPHDALVRFHLADAEVAAVARLRGGTLDVRGRLTLDGEVRGDLSRPRSWQGQVRVDGSDVTLPGALARLGIGRVKAVARTNAGEVVSDVDASWPSANLTARAQLDSDRRLRLQARGRADLSALPQWAGRAVDVQLSGDGTWPLVAGTAVVDLTRAGVRRDADRIDIRLTPVKGPTPRWTGSLQSRRVSLPWVDVDALQTAIALSTAALEVERLTARVAGVSVQGSGRWSWDGIGAARIVAGPVALGAFAGCESRSGSRGHRPRGHRGQCEPGGHAGHGARRD